MYCPKCGSQNQDDLKFCTRCGTNLGVVSDALGGKFENGVEVDEDLVNLLKNYYRGRRMTVAGLLLSILMVFKFALFGLMGMPEKLMLLVPLLGAFFIFGMVWFIWGATKWNNSSSELKALGYHKPENAIPKSPKSIAELSSASTIINVKKYNTDSINMPVGLENSMVTPPSVTDQTTRHLEEEGEKRSQPDKVLY